MLTRDMNTLRNNFISQTIGKRSLGSDLVYTLTEDLWLEGCRIGLSGHVEGESLEFQLHHPMLGHLTDYDFGQSVNVNPDQWLQIEYIGKYWAMIQSGMIIKIIYNKDESNANQVNIYADFFMHKEKS